MIKKNSKSKKVLRSIIEAPRIFNKGVVNAQFHIGATSKRKLQSLILLPPKTGRIYGNHQASAPGEAPADDTSKLRKSVNYIVRPSEVVFGDGEFYGSFLEKGTEKMEPRPHVQRTAEEQSEKNKQALLRFVDREIKRSAK